MAGPPCLQTGVVARESQRGGRGDGYDSLGLKHSYRQSATVTAEKNVQGGFPAGLLLTPPPFHQVITPFCPFLIITSKWPTNQPTNLGTVCEWCWCFTLSKFHAVSFSTTAQIRSVLVWPGGGKGGNNDKVGYSEWDGHQRHHQQAAPHQASIITI